MKTQISVIAIVIATSACSSTTQPGDAGDADAGSACTQVEIELAPASSNSHFEGIAASADGTLYVGGFLSKNIMRVKPCSDGPVEFVAAGILGNVTGLLVEDDVLWACHSDFGQTPPNPRVSAINLADATVRSTHSFPSGSGICNDLVLDGDGHLYLTDSFANRIVKISADVKERPGENADTAQVWSADTAFGSLMPMTFGLNGIAWDGANNIYSVGFHGHISDADPNTLDPSHLYRIPIQADGAAGAAEIVGDLPFGDGLEWLGANRFLVNEQSSVVSIMELTAAGLTTTPVATGLDFSTTSVVVGDGFWVVEGQLDHFLDPTIGPATSPFLIKRFELP